MKIQLNSDNIYLLALDGLCKLEKVVDEQHKTDIEFAKAIITYQQKVIDRLKKEAKPQEQTTVEEDAIIFNGKKYPGLSLADVIKLNETEAE